MRTHRADMKILLIDDHPLFAFGFARAMGDAAYGMLVLTATDLEKGAQLIDAHPDLSLALIDYHLGGDDGLRALVALGERHPWLARVLISGQEDPALQQRARRAGALGFIGKSLPVESMAAALYTVSEGGLHFGVANSQFGADSEAPTDRQLEVLSLLSQGLPNKRIAIRLGITERTVKLHVASLLERLRADNRTHLLIKARERGLA